MKTEKRKTGFASMDPKRQREIAALGGRTAHEQGAAHRFTSEEARQAGVKGGYVTASKPGHMSRIGRLGALVSREVRKKK